MRPPLNECLNVFVINQVVCQRKIPFGRLRPNNNFLNQRGKIHRKLSSRVVRMPRRINVSVCLYGEINKDNTKLVFMVKMLPSGRTALQD